MAVAIFLDWTIHPAEVLLDLQDDWRRINSRSTNLPVLDPEYVMPLLEYGGTGREVLAVGRVNGEPRAMAVFIQAMRTGSWHSFEAAGCPLGVWVCDLMQPLEQTLAGLFRALPGFTMVVAVKRQDPDLVPRPDDAGRTRTVDYIETAKITVRGTFTDYWQTRDAKFRSEVRRRTGRLTKKGVATRLDVVVEPAAVAEAVDEYGRLEAAGWKGGTGNALHPDNAQGRFFRDMMQSLAHRREAIVYRYLYDDSLAASQLCLCRDGILISLRTTYDESLSDTAPGIQIQLEICRQAFDGGAIKAIEFYGEALGIHRKWSDELRRMYHVNVYRWGVLPKIHDASSFFAQRLLLGGRMRARRPS